MNLIFSRTLKALCTVVVAGVLTACGSSSTYEPFVPTRVVGLGDGYNDPASTVRETGSTTGTVVGQVAAYFGLGSSNVVNQSSTGAKISALAGQIDSVPNGFSSGDLVVIAVGTHDVIGNDPASTVRETGSTTGTVVGQVAAYFGQSNVVNASITGAKISAIEGQIDDVVANHNGFSSGDLVVIAVGTHDVIGNDAVNGTTPITTAEAESASTALFVQVQRLQNLGVKHILIMPILEVSRTPWGRAHNFSGSATTTLNDKVLGKVPSGYNQNPVIYANASSITSQFLLATSTYTYSTFTDTGVDASGVATTPACGAASVSAMAGCDAVDSNSNPVANSAYGTMLFADGIHLTPAGNRWVAQFLFNATSNGWR